MLAGVTVTLTGVDRDGQPYTLTTTTCDTGAYELRYLNVGEHTITFGPPSGWTPTAPGGDSDAPSIKLNLSEQVTRGVDAGFRQPGEVNVTKTATVDGQPVTSVVPGTTVDYTVGITNPAERPFTDLFERWSATICAACSMTVTSSRDPTPLQAGSRCVTVD